MKCCAVGMLIYRLVYVSPHIVLYACCMPPFGICHFLIAQMRPRSASATQTNNFSQIARQLHLIVVEELELQLLLHLEEE